MSLRFIQEDGQRNAYDEEGFVPVELDVTNVQFPLGNVTDYDSYMDLKPPEKEQKMEEVQEHAIVERSTPKWEYMSHSNEKKNLFRLIYEKDYTVPQAVEELDIKRRTAYYWFKKDQDETIKNLTEKDLV